MPLTQMEDLQRRVKDLEQWRNRVDDRLSKGAKTMAVMAEKLETLQLTVMKPITDLKATIDKLDEKLDDLCLKFAGMAGSGKGKNAMGEGIVKYGGWALAIASFLYSVLK